MAVPTTVVVRDKNASSGDGNERFHLLVMGPDVFATYPLPDAGEVHIGRAEDAGVVVDDPLTSRHHAVLRMGVPIQIVDLGSANGTSVRGVALSAHQPTTIVPGEAVTIGETLLMVQPNRTPFRPRRVWPHLYFEGRLQEECDRVQSGGRGSAVARLTVTGGITSSTFATIAASTLRPTDILATYGPEEYEILLVGVTPPEAEVLVRAIIDQLTGAGFAARHGTANLPRDGRHAEALIATACERLRGPFGTPAASTSGALVSPAMVGPLRLADRAATSDISVLILGETGVGKEVMAARIHERSRRAKQVFVAVNCGALAENLLESELFGFERGAFTGATQAKKGLIEAAAGGTLFLDEVGEMPASVQVKLLRVLERREVLRIGSTRPVAVDLRVLAATNRNLEAEVAGGAFRIDLLYRLNALTIDIPPLRERVPEIVALARRFLEDFCRRDGRATVPSVSDEAAALLEAYCWPGNIRELRNVMERALVLCADDRIEAEHLPVDKMTVAVPQPAQTSAAPAGDQRDQVIAALAACGGNQSRAAKLLGVSRRTVINWIDKYQLPRPIKSEADERL
jgi:two-component system, NtrC family, response regulator AtoC